MARTSRTGARDVALRVVRDGVAREFPDVDVDTATAMLTLVGAARRVDAWLQAALKPLDLVDSSAAVVLALALEGRPYRMSASALNERLVITSGGITRTVDRLASARLVTRVADPDDGRRVLVQLTARGRRVAHEVLVTLLDAYEGRATVDDTVASVLAAFADVPRPR
jgi:DNA-binding MarR family transcriptional regulator